MTNDKAIGKLVALQDGNGDTYEAIRMAIEALEHSQWIPCSEQLPEEGEVVLICVQFEYTPKMFVASRQDYNYWTGVGARFAKEMVAWMPLPEPWKGKDDEY